MYFFVDIPTEETIRPPSGYEVWFNLVEYRRNHAECKYIRPKSIQEFLELTDVPVAAIVFAIWSPTQLALAIQMAALVPPNRVYQIASPCPLPGVSFLQERDAVHNIIDLPSLLTDEELQEYASADQDLRISTHPEHAVPLITSRGCPMGCTFCPTTLTNTARQFSYVSARKISFEGMVKTLLARTGREAIVVMDDDALLDAERAVALAETIFAAGCKWSAMATSKSFVNFDRYTRKVYAMSGFDLLYKCGLVTLEVGLEEFDLDKGGFSSKNVDFAKFVELADAQPEDARVSITYLNMTFLPDCTVESLQKTGQFLAKHGQTYEERLAYNKDNGTAGGLGQFAVLYPNSASLLLWKQYMDDDDTVVYTSTGTRLLPSIVPGSFVRSLLGAAVLNPWRPGFDPDTWANLRKWWYWYRHVGVLQLDLEVWWNACMVKVSTVDGVTQEITITSDSDRLRWVLMKSPQNAVGLALLCRHGIIGG